MVMKLNHRKDAEHAKELTALVAKEIVITRIAEDDFVASLSMEKIVPAAAINRIGRTAGRIVFAGHRYIDTISLLLRPGTVNIGRQTVSDTEDFIIPWLACDELAACTTGEAIVTCRAALTGSFASSCLSDRENSCWSFPTSAASL
jgi:hypothetical protein